MSKEHIITVPDARLRRISERVGIITPETTDIAERMIAATKDWEAYRRSEVGVALAAVQIGELQRIVVIRTNPEDKENPDFQILINPQITKHEGQPVTEPEGCLSIPDIYGVVPRYPVVRIKALDINGRPTRFKAEGFLARVFQHEIDHMHGKLFVDKVEDEVKEGDIVKVKLIGIDDMGRLKLSKKAAEERAQ
jgi:peptide deformylase